MTHLSPPTLFPHIHRTHDMQLLISCVCIVVFFLPLSVLAQVDGNHTFYPRYEDDFGDSKAKLNERNIRLRDDILWHAEAANVVYQKAGNASLLSASRYGLTDRLEISTYLAEDVARPAIYAKLLWRIFKKKWYFSSRFDVANAYPGMSLAQSLGITRVIGEDTEIPLVFEAGAEALLSRAWFTDPNCSDGSIYFILTFGLGAYGGVNFSSVDDLQQVRFHFLANRGETVTGTGLRGRFKVWLDGRITNRIKIHGGMYYHFGTFTKHHALELQCEGEYFFNSKISAKLGFLTSFANYKNIDKNAGIWPILDFTYYFGKRKLHSGTLFQPGVYHGSKY